MKQSSHSTSVADGCVAGFAHFYQVKRFIHYRKVRAGKFSAQAIVELRDIGQH